MNYIKLFEEYSITSKFIPDFDSIDMVRILSNIPMVKKPSSWEEVEEHSVDLDDFDDEILKSLFKLPVYNVTDLNEFFDIKKEDPIYDELFNITANNYIFYEDLKIQQSLFIIRFQMKNIDCGLLVDTQGFNYMRYVALIKEFGDMYDYYKKDLELRNRN